MRVRKGVYMHKELVGSVICTAVAGTSTAIQPDVIFQYIQMGLTIIATLITIILGIRAWWKDAKKDGKITKDEIEQGISIINDGVENIKDITKGNKENEIKNKN